MSLATPPTLSLSFPSRVATARGSHARTAADLVADVLPATLRPQDGVHLAHRVPQHLASHSTSLTEPSSTKFTSDRTSVAAKVVAGANSGHPDPNGLHQELRLVLSSTAVVSATHLVAETAKTTSAAASGSPVAKRRCSRPGFDHGWALVDSPESMIGGAQPC